VQARILIVDTNIVVAGLLTSDQASPPARILDAMLEGKLLYLLSAGLLEGYSAVLRRPRIAGRHGLADSDIDSLLTELVANAIWREAGATSPALDSGDDHLRDLLAAESGSVLVTGDELLLNKPPKWAAVISTRRCVESVLSAVRGPAITIFTLTPIIQCW
jgi:predicted nucleic acid-binding protein